MSLFDAGLLALASLPTILLAAYIIAVLGRGRRRRRRAGHLHTLSDREVVDALAPFGADISIWPSRAPRNGTTHDPVE